MSKEIFVEVTGNVSKVAEVMNYGLVFFPRYLVSRQTYEEKMAVIRSIISESKSRLAEGVSTVDAGDTHGQYHDELAWYREQEISMANQRASGLGEGLDYAFIVESYDIVRSEIEKVLSGGEKLVTLGTNVTVVYQDDDADIETVLIVAPLDGGANPGWVSVNAPLAKAIEGKRVGEECFMGDKKNPIKLKLLAVE